MYGLLYPAFLGAVFYELLPIALGVSSVNASWDKHLLAWLIALHFAIDYALAAQVPRYGWQAFVCDMLVISGLCGAFFAVGLTGSTVASLVNLCYFLVVAYLGFLLFLAVLWPYLTNRLWLLLVEISGIMAFVVIGFYRLNAWLVAGSLTLLAVLLPMAANKSLKRTQPAAAPLSS